MKITLFTSNDKRHNFFINMLSEVSEELFVVQECKQFFLVLSQALIQLRKQ